MRLEVDLAGTTQPRCAPAAMLRRCASPSHDSAANARRTTYSGGAACVGPSGSWAVLSAVQGTQGTHGDSGGTLRRSVEIMGTVGWVLGVLPRHSGVLREIRLLTVLRGDWWRSGPIRGTPWYSGYSGGRPRLSAGSSRPSILPGCAGFLRLLGEPCSDNVAQARCEATAQARCIRRARPRPIALRQVRPKRAGEGRRRAPATTVQLSG
jgi:hypothetical protein